MESNGSGIAVGCTSCAVDLFLDAAADEDEDEVRRRLAAFFAAHDRCDVFMDVSRTAGPLPRRPRP